MIDIERIQAMVPDGHAASIVTDDGKEFVMVAPHGKVNSTRLCDADLALPDETLKKRIRHMLHNAVSPAPPIPEGA